MRVLIINAIYGSRSSGRSISDIKKFLENENNEVYIATPYKTDGDNCYQIGSDLDHKIHAFLSRVTGLQGYFSILATRRFIKYIEKIKPDIIHMQVIHGNYINFGMFIRYVSEKKIPIVFVLDDCWYFTGKCCHYIGDKCFKWKDGCNHCVRKKDDNPSWIFDFSKKMYNDKRRFFSSLDKYAVVAVSDWLKKEAGQSILKNATILTRIYNSIDIEQFQYREDCDLLKRELGINDKKIILGVATAWKDSNGLSKGIGLFIELANKISDNYLIILIGEMDPDIKLPDNIKSIDFVDGAGELSRYYSMADVFVQMSSEETFGKVTAEALCCGTPVIVFDSTANPELVGPGCGFVVENKNVGQILDKVNEIIYNGREAYSKDCRRFAENNFESVSNAGAYLELYRTLIDISNKTI